MSGWSETMVSIGGVLPQVLEGAELVARLRHPGAQERWRELYVRGEGLYYVYDFTWAEQIGSAVGNIRGPMSSDGVARAHPEFMIAEPMEEDA